MAGIVAKRVAAVVKGFVGQMMAPDEPFFRRRLREHFNADPASLTIVGEKFQAADHPNVHLAVEAFVNAPPRRSELIGITSEHADYMGISIAHLAAPSSRHESINQGPVRYTNIALADDRILPCTKLGLYLVSDGDQRLAILVHVLFVLTTNRPELLEPALAARPGRIDQAIEVPVPDAECRRRLFELYGRGLEICAPLDAYVSRTAGVSAAFVRELLRKAALFAADDGAQLKIGERHFDAAVHEMLVEGGPLTKSLLGAVSVDSVRG